MKAWIARRLRELAVAGALGRRDDPPSSERDAVSPPGDVPSAPAPGDPVSLSAAPPADLA